MTTVAERKAGLEYLGFRTDTKARYIQAKRDFQRAKGMPITGVADPVTQRAIAKAVNLRRAGKPNLTTNFSFHDFQCKCSGRYRNCKRIWIRRRQVVAVQKLRNKVGPFKLVSACRCPSYNELIGSMPGSRHVVGDAVDIPSRWKAKTVIGYRLFTGIGTGANSGNALHGDTRPGSVWSPVRWYYRGW